jgi:hypothetical protein
MLFILNIGEAAHGVCVSVNLILFFELPVIIRPDPYFSLDD